MYNNMYTYELHTYTFKFECFNTKLLLYQFEGIQIVLALEVGTAKSG